jgi:hypothetical protein
MRINWTWLIVGMLVGAIVVPRTPFLNRIAI